MSTDPSTSEAGTHARADPASHRGERHSCICETLRSLGAHVETGKFGAYMTVALVNDGPVTI
ncbi:MAG: D-aminoacyl-tRNA deacylase [Rhodococcus sp. (in: high G+C Gram-positive bacteria)]